MGFKERKPVIKYDCSRSAGKYPGGQGETIPAVWNFTAYSIGNAAEKRIKKGAAAQSGTKVWEDAEKRM